jgi:aldose 1-epimerase
MDRGLPPTLELEAGPSRLVLSPGFGGTILRYATRAGDGWLEWLRPAIVAPQTPGDTACFPLVPFSNRVRDGRFVFQGREVALPRVERYGRHFRHGFGCLAAWSVAARAADRAVLEFREDGASWPFPFRARQEFRLGPASLTVAMEIENTGTAAMPAGIGLHPYFPRTPACRLEAAVAAMWTADADLLPVDLVAPPAGSNPGAGILPSHTALDTVFAGWSRRARIEWPERAAALAMTAGPPFDFLVVFTPPGKDFFCVEPVSHMTDAFNLAAQGRTDTGMAVLPPGGTLAGAVAIAVEWARP